MEWQHSQITRSFKVGPEDNHHLFSFFSTPQGKRFGEQGSFALIGIKLIQDPICSLPTAGRY